jgi:hypothetical protein
MAVADLIPYREYITITKLMHAHVAELGDSLHAIIVFGDLTVGGDTFDIELLEIVDNWKGMLRVTADSSAELPLRGTLRLHFLTPEQFRNPTENVDAADRQWVLDLIDRVKRSYGIIYENPPNFARSLLANERSIAFTNTQPASGSVHIMNPLHVGPRT